MYLLFFYTNIYGLDPADAATMFLVVRLVDVLWDPLVGTYVDKHSPKLGKYRSYLVFGGIPLTGFAILCFWNGFAPSLVYAYVTYVGMSMLYTLINVPYGALNSSLTRDTNEITILTSTRMFMANLGALCVKSLPLIIALFAPKVLNPETVCSQWHPPCRCPVCPEGCRRRSHHQHPRSCRCLVYHHGHLCRHRNVVALLLLHTDQGACGDGRQGHGGREGV